MSGCSYLNNRLKALRYCPDPSTFSDSENVWFDIFLKLSSGPTNNLILLTAVLVEQRHRNAADFIFQLYWIRFDRIYTLPGSWDEDEYIGTTIFIQ